MIYGLYHAPTETVGSIQETLSELKLPFKKVQLFEGEGLPRDTSDLEGLIIMGGPMNVDDVHDYPFLLPEVQLIEKILSEKKPVLGICLGAQLMAKALGERVYPQEMKEVGWHPIELTAASASDPHFQKFPKKFTALHWHGDTFDLPKGTVHLAKTQRCANQAFRWGNNSYALQFHFEVTPAMLQYWCGSKSEQAFIELAGESADKILKKSGAAFEKLEPLSKEFFQSYFKAAYSHLLVPA